jgi:hypothetical protein
VYSIEIQPTFRRNMSSCLAFSSTLKMEATCSSETSVVACLEVLLEYSLVLGTSVDIRAQYFQNTSPEMTPASTCSVKWIP